jgi:hypothetical protein
MRFYSSVRFHALAASLFAALLLAPAAYAQDAAAVGSVQGFSLNLSLGGGALEADESGFEDEADEVYGGGGLALGIAYGFNETAELFLDLGAYALDVDEDGGFGGSDFDVTGGMAHFDLGARFYFANADAKVRPFALFAFSGRSFATELGDTEFDVTITQTLLGGAATYGGGLRYFFRPGWAFSAQLTTSFGEFTDAETEAEGSDLPIGFDTEDIEDLHADATSARLQLGIAWYPGR